MHKNKILLGFLGGLILGALVGMVVAKVDGRRSNAGLFNSPYGGAYGSAPTPPSDSGAPQAPEPTNYPVHGHVEISSPATNSYYRTNDTVQLKTLTVLPAGAEFRDNYITVRKPTSNPNGNIKKIPCSFKITKGTRMMAECTLDVAASQLGVGQTFFNVVSVDSFGNRFNKSVGIFVQSGSSSGSQGVNGSTFPAN